MFLSLDPGTFIIQIVNFLVFFGILSVVFTRPVGKAIAQRREYIESVAADYERYQTQAAANKAQVDAVRAAARRDAEALLAKSRAEASNEAAEISSDYSQRSSSIIDEATRAVNAELESARSQEASLVRELAEMAVQRALAEPAS